MSISDIALIIHLCDRGGESVNL